MSENLFVDIWNLISCDAVRKNGCVLPIYGKKPVGRLFYDANGNLSVHIMKDGRPNFVNATKFRASAMEMRAAYEVYEAFFSTYDVDQENGVIIHHLIGGLFPNWIGSDQSRYYKFDGDRLILSTDPIGAISNRKTIVTLVWEKLS